jgi:hypothetical protein
MQTIHLMETFNTTINSLVKQFKATLKSSSSVSTIGNSYSSPLMTPSNHLASSMSSKEIKTLEKAIKQPQKHQHQQQQQQQLDDLEMI